MIDLAPSFPAAKEPHPYQFAPADRVNPWLGYGIGVESTGFSASNGGSSLSVAAAGVEFGHFIGGVDFRLSRTVGIGPFVDFSFGQYTSESIKENGVTTTGTIEQTALHEWLLVGRASCSFPKGKSRSELLPEAAATRHHHRKPRSSVSSGNADPAQPRHHPRGYPASSTLHS